MTEWRGARCALGVVLFPALAGAAFASAQPAGTRPDYTILPLQDPPNRTTVPVPPDGRVELLLCRAGDKPAKSEAVDLRLTSFLDAQGRRVSATLRRPGEPVPSNATPSNAMTFTVEGSEVPLELRVADPDMLGEFAGHLLVSREGTRLKLYPLTLKRNAGARNAKLVVDRRAVTVDVVRPFFSSPDEPPAGFEVTLRDESGAWPLAGLHARLEEAGKPENVFSPQRDIRFEVNGARADLWRLDDGSGRTVPAGGQAALRGVLAELPPGQHSAKIRITAANSQADAGQVIDVRVNVRRSLPFAIGILILGIAVSLVLTVVLKARAAMLRLRLRILQARPMWLADEPASLVITWVRAIFNQAAALRQQFTVAATDLLDERVTQAIRQLPLLGGVGDLRRRIDGQAWDAMVRRRAHKVLQRISARLVPGVLDDTTAEAIRKSIGDLAMWLDGSWREPYGNDLQKDIDTLLAVVDVDKVQEDCRGDVTKLIEELKTKPDPERLLRREGLYAALKLVWERVGDAAHVKELLRLWATKTGIEPLFRCADRQTWEKLKQDPQLRFVSPMPSFEPYEPFQPLRFEVGASREVSGTYLFKHNVDYEWRFVADGPEPVVLEPKTREPHVMQYVPRKCTVRCSVRLHYAGEYHDVPADPRKGPFTVAVSGSYFKRLMRSIEANEMIALGLSVVVGTATGLLTQYFGHPDWGSARDCVGLFLWGAGADQASKSFVDVLGRFPRWQNGGQPATTSSTTVTSSASTSGTATATSEPATGKPAADASTGTPSATPAENTSVTAPSGPPQPPPSEG